MHLIANGSYDLRSVVFSHGWADLPPFRVLKSDGTLRTVVRRENQLMSVQVSPIPNGVRADADGEVPVKELRWMLRMDEDLSSFYVHTRDVDRPWIEKRHMGRLLRSQSPFEDLIKLILTTNCSWAFTRKMSDQLCESLGGHTVDGLSGFPTPEDMARKTERFYRDKIRSGYRAPYLRAIGKQVAEKKLDPWTWADPKRPTAEIRKEILSLPGAGPYVADNLLRFLGRFDFLGLDSWARGKLKELWNMRKVPTDRAIQKRYKPHGSFQGLVLWCDLTKDWLEDKDFASWIRTEIRTDQ